MSNIYMVRTPKDVLTAALRELRIAPSAKVTFERFPALGKAAEGLAWHLTDRVVVPVMPPFPATVPLLHLCLGSAFAWLNFAATQPVRSPRTAQTAFLAGLMYHTPEIQHVQVADEGAEPWSAFHDAPLGEWLPSHPGASITTRELELQDLQRKDRDIRYALLQRVFPEGSLSSVDITIQKVLDPSEDMHPTRDDDGRR